MIKIATALSCCPCNYDTLPGLERIIRRDIIVKEFKEFAMGGNVVDMAVGIVIGAVFGTIITSLVADVIMPPMVFFLVTSIFSIYLLSLGMWQKLPLHTPHRLRPKERVR